MIIIALLVLALGAFFITRTAPRNYRTIDRFRKVAGVIMLFTGVVVFVGEIV